MRLITKNDILNHRQLSKTVKEITMNQFIDDAQVTDLLPLLGEAFYFTILADPTNFTDLLNEKQYVYDGVTITSPGLKKVLIDFATARYILHGSQTDTPFGMVEKQYQDGIQVSRTDKKERYKARQQTAMTLWYQIEKYLNRHTELYPKWDSGCTTKRRKFRINKISR
jgi:hypothetical protein